MERYTVYEIQKLNNQRKGTEFEAHGIREAKRWATRWQMFAGTVLRLEKNGVLVAYKIQKRWHDIPFEGSFLEGQYDSCNADE